MSSGQPPQTAIPISTITCPRCGHRASERMPVDACQFFYDCKGCGARCLCSTCTHQQLLTAIDEPATSRLEFFLPTADVEQFGAALRALVAAVGRLGAALRAVVELHHEFVSEDQPDVPTRLCDECDTSVPYPCPTLIAIAKALGIGEAP